MLRSTFAVAAGYLTLAVAANLAILLTFTVVGPSLAGGSGVQVLSANSFVLSLVFRGVSATLGGYVTATLAPRRPVTHGLALGVVILLVDLLVAALTTGNQPRWYRPLMSGGGAALAVLGACVPVRRRRSPHAG